ncbi:hypothetical protein A1F99_078450 [Pyrenophora tritici-repentis]|nr:hypothetical protein A1F99_078450 [Pyrenophora tritici-repentis]
MISLYLMFIPSVKKAVSPALFLCVCVRVHKYICVYLAKIEATIPMCCGDMLTSDEGPFAVCRSNTIVVIIYSTTSMYLYRTLTY